MRYAYVFASLALSAIASPIAHGPGGDDDEMEGMAGMSGMAGMPGMAAPPVAAAPAAPVPASNTTALVQPAAAAVAAPKNFAVQITATVDGKPETLFLSKKADGSGVTNIKDAASCSIGADTRLTCSGKAIGINKPSASGYVDMAPLGPAKSRTNAIETGWSVDANNLLHWKNADFATLPTVGRTIMAPAAQGGQDGEAKWGLFKSLLTANKPQLYAQLGCPGGSHNGVHAEVIIGQGKVVPT